ncbi:uncharacterized protein LOC134280572 [Saccostrea cucullata]|uniref:uncharacterized protein LOC134280572 n=1 Tax=Saccostrea cuccullata TaxID=36930 RepID=UPI002ED28DA0
MGDNGYHSDHDWDARSVRSFRSDGYLSDATSHRSRPPVNDRTFVNPENSKNDRRSVENHKTFAENDRKSVVGREETNSHSNYKTENNGKNSERRSSLVNGNSVIQSVREEDTERRGKRSSAGKKKEVSWSDKGRPEDKKEDLNTNNNRSDQRDTPNIITETVAEASEGKGLQSSAQLSDHVKEPRNSANGVKSGSTHPELEIVTESTSAKETERAAVENPAKSTYRGSEAGEVLRSKIGTESSFEKSEADTLISNVNSGYQGDVSDTGADEKTDSNNRLKKPKVLI